MIVVLPPWFPAIVASALLASASLGCQADEAPDHISRYVDIYVISSEATLCAGSLNAIDRYIERAFDFLEESIPAGFSIPVYVGGDLPRTYHGFYDSSTGQVLLKDFETSRGLRRPLGVLRHELTHAIADEVWGQSSAFFTEGLAEALSRPSAFINDVPPPPAPIERMLVEVDSLEIDYLAAARFVRFLVDRYGVPRFRQVYQNSAGLSLQETKDLLEEVYEQPFALLESSYLEEPTVCRLEVDQCDPEETEIVVGGWSKTYLAACEDPSFIGAASADSSSSGLGTSWTLQIEHSGDYRLRSLAPVTLSRCGSCAVQNSIRTSFGTDMSMFLPAGLYVVEVEHGGDPHGVLDISLTPEIAPVEGSP